MQPSCIKWSLLWFSGQFELPVEQFSDTVDFQMIPILLKFISPGLLIL